MKEGHKTEEKSTKKGKKRRNVDLCKTGKDKNYGSNRSEIRIGCQRQDPKAACVRFEIIECDEANNSILSGTCYTLGLLQLTKYNYTEKHPNMIQFICPLTKNLNRSIFF